jgi:uncharacterized protein (TIGR03435 family)
MRKRVLTFVAALMAASVAPVGQTRVAPGDLKYDVVSIKRNTSGAIGSNGSVPQRPDGGFVMLNIPIGTLVGQAFETAPVDMVGLPGWAMSMNERYDVSATASLTSATPEQRRAMLRAMLEERMKLVVRVEPREQPVYDLVMARADGSLGPGITRSETDCEAKLAEQRAAVEAALAAGTAPPPPTRPDFNAPVSCTFSVAGERMDGESEIAGLARMLRSAAGRLVVDKTGLKGTYRIAMTFDRMAALRGPQTTAEPGGAPSVFTAVQEQLGMKLEASTAMRDTLIIERLERPTEN